MTIKEFLQAYPISRSVFYSEKRKGKIKVRKLGSRTYILKKDAEIWVENLESPVV